MLRARSMDWRTLVIASIALGGCSFLRDPGDFTIGDGGPDGAGPVCMDVADCPARSRTSVSCEGSVCVYTCEAGFDDCDGDPINGCETDTTRDLDHCGGCGMACTFDNANGTCTSSTCELMACRVGFEDCDGDSRNGCEANLRSTSTCGSCAETCAAGELCDSTGATPVCNADCAGTVCGDECVDTSTNPLRCGDCDTACPVPTGASDATCADAMCGFECLAGRDDCDPDAEGCETNTTNDLANCGGCGLACDDTNVSSQSCDDSTCTIVECEDGFDDCNADPADGCEADLNDTETCGACGNVCAVGTACSEGVCDPPIQVSIGTVVGCLVRESRRVACWGDNEDSVAGVGTPVGVERAQTIIPGSAPDAPDFLANEVQVGSAHACAIGTDEELYCWGNGVRIGGPGGNTPFPQAVVADTEAGLFGPREFVALSTSYAHTCAIDDMGAVWCWGVNTNGSVPGTGDALGARRVMGLPSAAVDVMANQDASCAVIDDGSVWCWGTNGVGQLGNDDATGTASATPVQVVGLTSADSIFGHWRTFCAISDGTLDCWGDNTNGSIGVRGPGNLERTPVEVATNVQEAWALLYAVCWRDDTGVSCQGRKAEGQFGDGTIVPGASEGIPVRNPLLDPIRNVSGGRSTACGLDRSRAYCWGNSFRGAVPRDTLQLEAPTPVADDGGSSEAGFSQVRIASSHGCGVRTALAYCWGAGGSGQRGDATNHSLAYPTQVINLSDVRDVAVSEDASCAIEGTQAYCWGANGNGLLGSTGSSTATPRMVELAGAEVAIEAGSYHFCAIDDGGAVHCWGGNASGQLGRPPSTTEMPGETTTSFDDAIDLAMGHEHTCVLRSGGTVECFGSNLSRQLGDGTSTSRHTAAPVSGLTNVVAIAAGSAHTCALQSSGQVRCWGANNFGQLGDGTSSSTTTPVLTSYNAMPAVAIAGGRAHSCAAYMDGSVRCWGDGVFHQTSFAARVLDPTIVPGVGGVTALTGGTVAGYTTCAVRGDASPAGSISCWGRNLEGVAATGESLYYQPTEVVLP